FAWKPAKDSNPVSSLALHPRGATEFARGTESTQESLAPVQHSRRRGNDGDLAGLPNSSVPSSFSALVSPGSCGLAWPGASRGATISRDSVSFKRHLSLRLFHFCRALFDSFLEK